MEIFELKFDFPLQYVTGSYILPLHDATGSDILPLNDAEESQGSQLQNAAWSQLNDFTATSPLHDAAGSKISLQHNAAGNPISLCCIMQQGVNMKIQGKSPRRIMQQGVKSLCCMMQQRAKSLRCILKRWVKFGSRESDQTKDSIGPERNNC